MSTRGCVFSRIVVYPVAPNPKLNLNPVDVFGHLIPSAVVCFDHREPMPWPVSP